MKYGANLIKPDVTALSVEVPYQEITLKDLFNLLNNEIIKKASYKEQTKSSLLQSILFKEGTKFSY